MSWMVSVAVPADDVDVVSSLLWDLDTTGVAEAPDPRSATTGAEAPLVAGFDDELGAESAVRTLTELGYRASHRPYVADWAATEAVTISRSGVEFTIAVGEAFGHGGHPTTQLCLDLLLERLASTGQGATTSLVDVGAGTGVLAIAGALAGARPVIAVEIDPAARAVSAANIATTGADIGLVEHLDQAMSDQPFDLAVANLLLADLRPLVPTLRKAAQALLLSGFLVEQEDEVVEQFDGWRRSRRRTSGPWVGLVLERPSAAPRSA